MSITEVSDLGRGPNTFHSPLCRGSDPYAGRLQLGPPHQPNPEELRIIASDCCAHLGQTRTPSPSQFEIVGV